MPKKKKTSSRKRGADGLYHVHKFICFREDGSRFYKRFSAASYNDVIAEANTFKKEYLAGLHQGADVQKPAEKPLTLGEAMDKYIDTCRILSKSEDFSHATIPGYLSIRKNAFKDLMDKPVKEITVDDVQTSLEKRLTQNSERTGKPISVKSLRNEYYLLKPVLEKYAPDLNLKPVKLPKRRKKKLMVLENADAPVILKAAYDMHPDFFVYTLLTMNTGMRPSEVYALRWRDLSAAPMIALANQQKLVYGEINVSRARTMNEFRRYEEKSTKTEAGERVLTHDWSMFETIYSVLQRGEDDEQVVKLNPRQQQYYWDKLRTALGMPKERRFYDLRHYHCSVMVAKGAPEDYIAADMGHSTIQMAHDVYVEIIGEKQRDINLGVAENTADLMNSFRNATIATKHATQKPELVSII